MEGNRQAGILIVDDDAFLRRAVIRTLRPLAVPLREAQDGAEALAAIAAQPPAVVLTDYVMPGMTGRELVERIALEHPEIRLVIHSGNAHHLLARIWWPDFDLTIVPKPAPPDVLVKVVADALSSRR